MSYVTVTTEDGRPAEALAKLLEQRSKYMNETAEQSCAAVMIDVLVSLRAATLLAKPTKEEIVLVQTPLMPSFSGPKNSRKFCLRNGKARYVPKDNERIRRAAADLNNCHVWKWQRFNKGTYLIVAHSKSEAEKWAIEAAKRFAKQRKGLAKHALSVLMQQSGSKTSVQPPNTDIAKIASSIAKVTKSKNGKAYSLHASDLLEYAKLAIKGGDAAVSQALMRAANKVAHIINMKCKNLLLFKKIESPFPELKTSKH